MRVEPVIDIRVAPLVPLCHEGIKNVDRKVHEPIRLYSLPRQQCTEVGRHTDTDT